MNEKILKLREENVSNETIEYGIVDENPTVRVNGIISAVVNKAMDPGIDESFHEVFDDYTPFMMSYTVADIAVAGYYLITGNKVKTNAEIESLLECKDEIFHF